MVGKSESGFGFKFRFDDFFQERIWIWKPLDLPTIALTGRITPKVPWLCSPSLCTSCRGLLLYLNVSQLCISANPGWFRWSRRPLPNVNKQGEQRCGTFGVTDPVMWYITQPQWRRCYVWIYFSLLWVGLLLSSVTATWEFGVPLMENFIPASMVWDAIATKHD